MEEMYGLPNDQKNLDSDPSSNVPRRRSDRVHQVAITVLCLLIAGFWFPTLPWSRINHACLHKLTIEQRASKILSEHPLIDGHNDLMIFVRGKYQNHIYDSEFKDKFENGGFPQHVDLPRLDQGKQGGAFWSAFWPCPSGENGTDFSDDKYSTIVRSTLDQLDLFRRLGQSYPKYFTPALNSHEASKAFKEGRLISPVAIEGLHQIGNSLSTLRLFHQLGVRYATLTWNCHNKYADAALEFGPNFEPKVATPFWHGLSPDGRNLVKEMNRMGMLVDLAHVSKETMKDVLIGDRDGKWTGSLAPPIFSHSSAYAICPHPRNVQDDILQFVKQRNSIVMVNFSPEFVSCVPVQTPSGLPEFYPQNNTLAHVVNHIMHIGELIGYDHVGLGSDFDGISHTPIGLEDVSKFPDLVAELLRRGVSDENVGKIIGRNILRVWKEADEVAAKLQAHTVPLEDNLQSQWS